jgi:hypothetical protein
VSPATAAPPVPPWPTSWTAAVRLIRGEVYELGVVAAERRKDILCALRTLNGTNDCQPQRSC